MTFDLIRTTALSLPHVTEVFPFDQSTLVFKVGDKMFLIIDIDLQDAITLKCKPDQIPELLESHDWISRGFHMNKNHWITLRLDTSQLDISLALKLITESYAIVYQGLTKKVKNALENR
jgi:predicted DNA-binding protein (MmcQ/YjbR family)